MLDKATVEILIPPLNKFPFTDFITPNLVKVSSNVLTTYPITLLSRSNKGLVDFYGFIYAYIYLDKQREKVLRLTSPLTFRNDGQFQQKILERLLDEVLELGESLKVSAIEMDVIEVFDHSLLRQPLSLEPFSNNPQPLLKNLLLNRGFKKVATREEFLLILKGPLPIKKERIVFRTIKDDSERLYNYRRLLITDDNFNEWLQNLNREMIIPTRGDRLYKKEENLLFFTIPSNDGQPIAGVVFWNPTSIFSRNYASKEAKILRILTIKKLDQQKKSLLLMSLIHHLYSSGFQNVFICEKEEHLEPLLSRNSFIEKKKVHSKITYEITYTFGY